MNSIRVYFLLLMFFLNGCHSVMNKIEHSEILIFLNTDDNNLSTFLYLNKYFTKNISDTNIYRTLHTSNRDTITFQPKICILPTKNGYEIHEFSIILLNSNITRKNFFNQNNNKIKLVNVEDLQTEFFVLPNIKYFDSTYKFGLYLIKLSNDDVEKYFPSSERLRIEIFDDNGRTVWKSNENKNYLTVIGELLPKEIGEYHYYEIEWNSYDIDKNILNNEFTVNYILPLQPKIISILKKIYLE